MITNKSWKALQGLLVYLMGQDAYNDAIDNNYTITDEEKLYNENFTPFAQAGINALVQDERERGPFYLLQNKFHPELWWNNDSGWGSCKTADVFNHQEKSGLDAPIDGIWVIEKDLRKEIDRLHGEVELWMSEEMR